MKPRVGAAIVLVLCLVAAGAHAGTYQSTEFPGLAQLYKKTAPSDLDRWLQKQIKKPAVPSSPVQAIVQGLRMMAYPGLATYEAERECAARGLIWGYSMGAAAGLWEVDAAFVKNEFWLRGPLSAMGAGCDQAHRVHHNVALARGYLEAMDIPLERRRILRDLLTAHIKEDNLWNSDFDTNLGFYTTYARAFQKYVAHPG